MPRWRGQLWSTERGQVTFDIEAGELRLGSGAFCEIRLPEGFLPHVCTLRLESDGMLRLIPLCAGVSTRGYRRHVQHDVDLRFGIGMSAIGRGTTDVHVSNLEASGAPSPPQPVPRPSNGLRLHWRDGEGEWREQDFAQEVIFLGRDARCDVVVRDRDVEPLALALCSFRGRWLCVSSPERMRESPDYLPRARHVDAGELWSLGDYDFYLEADMHFERLFPLGIPGAPSVRRLARRQGSLLVAWRERAGALPLLQVSVDGVFPGDTAALCTVETDRGEWRSADPTSRISVSSRAWVEHDGAAITEAHVELPDSSELAVLQRPLPVTLP